MYTPRRLNCGLGVGREGGCKKKRRSCRVSHGRRPPSRFPSTTPRWCPLPSTAVLSSSSITVAFLRVALPPRRFKSCASRGFQRGYLCVFVCHPVRSCTPLFFFDLFECMSTSIEIPLSIFFFCSVVVCAHVSVSICASLVFCSLA